MRYEDLMADPYKSTVDLYSKLFPRSGGHFPGRPPPPRSAAFPAGWHERVQKARASTTLALALTLALILTLSLSLALTPTLNRIPQPHPQPQA